MEESLATELGEPVRVHLARKFGLNAWTGNLVGALVTVGLGVGVFFSAAGFGFGTAAKPGAGVFPSAIAAIFVILGILWLLQCLTGVVAAPALEGAVDEDTADADHAKDSPEDPRSGRKLRWAPSPTFRVTVTVAVITGFGLLVEIFGYQLTMLVAMAALLHLVARSRWFTTIAISAVMAFGTFALFAFGLGVPLPVAEIAFLQELGL